MDNSIIRWYNKNRRSIWTTVLIIVAIIGLIQTLDYYYKNKQEVETENKKSSNTYNTNNYSIITQEKINETTSKETINIIDEFFKYCNNSEVENAYNLLSDECKKELYPTINDFQTKYYNRIFTENKSYNAMLWITDSTRNVYRIEIMEDLLAAGQKEDMPIEDYYTIIKENGNYKLNINNYIGKENINITKNENNIGINIVSRKIYMDYEKYEIQVQNNTGNKVIFNNKENTDSIYIKDSNDLEYIAFLNELSSSELEIINGITKTLEIKFNRGFKPTISIQEIVFEDIVINGETKVITVEI